MARRLRFVPKGAMVEVTNRTIQGRFLLRPTPELTDIILGIIGRAQARFGMVIHAFQFLSNHFHMLLSPRDAKNMADFMGFVESNLAKEGGKVDDTKPSSSATRKPLTSGGSSTSSLTDARKASWPGLKIGLVLAPRWLS
jgi:hypothetical protein